MIFYAIFNDEKNHFVYSFMFYLFKRCDFSKQEPSKQI